MQSLYASHTDARNSTFNDIGRDLVNITFHGQDILQKLEPVKMDASRRTECLPNTRTDILKFIFDWVEDATSQQNLLWLHGLAGSGKSTLATTIANICGTSGKLGAFLFFDRDVNHRSDPTSVIRTLAHQLASSDPRIGAAIRAAVEKNSNILMSSLHLQFQRLILDPLSIAHDATTIVVVLDALDECGTADDRENLLAVLANDFIHVPLAIRTIVMSRAEIDLYNAFTSRPHILVHELDITSPSNSDDILSYFRYRMSLIRGKMRHLRLDKDWPGDEVFRKLVKRASGLFVWASTASEFIHGHDPRRRLDVILNGEAGLGAENALDALYKTALEGIDLWDDEDFVADFRNIMGSIIVVWQPLSSSAIDALLYLPDDKPSMHTISLLGCVLQQSPGVRVLHPSFTEFLVTRQRCGRDIWFFDRPTCHRYLAFLCLDRMNAVLKHNMCNMTLSVDRADENLSEDVSYSCVFWINHVCAIEQDFAPIMDRLRGFLHRHFLHWFEALSILKRSRDSISLINRLLHWMSRVAPHETVLCELVGDACRFARSFAHSIEEHPLLVYTSLPFAPNNNAVYRAFHHADMYPFIVGGFQHSWSLLPQNLAGHVGGVLSVAVSPDGKWLASGSQDDSIRIWDTATGAEIFELLGHHDWVMSVAFSPDGTHIASGSRDTLIRLWDVTTGDMVMPILRGHVDTVTSVSFSPDGTKIVSGSQYGTLHVWDATAGARISSLQWRQGRVTSAVFSSDGTRIICGAYGLTVLVWDWMAASEILELRGHEGPVRTVNCSPDSIHIASGSGDRTIRVWDMTTGAMISELRGHEHWVTSVAFSPDGTRIVSGSADNDIRIWDVISPVEVLPPLRGHNDGVMSVVFSPDGKKVISGSLDGTIRIWDVPTRTDAIRTLRGHEHPVRSLAFSPDGTRLVSGSNGKTLRVWDTVSGAEILQMRGHGLGVLSARYSPDGLRIVSGSIDRTVRVWDAATGDEMMPPLRGHEKYVTSVTFSPDGTMIASGSADTTVRIWDVLSGIAVTELRGHKQAISSLAFSPNGCRIISGSLDTTLRVWDVTTGAQVFTPLHGHKIRMTSVFFSPDASRIISLSEYESLSWDAATGHRISSTEQSDHRLSGSIYVTYEGWIVDSETGRTLGKLPNMVADPISVVHGRLLAVGTPSGRVFIMQFPPALLTSPDTRTVEGGIRERFREPPVG